MVRALLLLSLLVGAACKDIATLTEGVNARVLVVGVDDDEIVVLDVADRSYRSEFVDDGLVEMQLTLPEGTHEGFVTIVRSRDDDEDEPRECGIFSITVVPGEVANAAIVVDDLEDCEEDDDDDSEDDDDL